MIKISDILQRFKDRTNKGNTAWCTLEAKGKIKSFQNFVISNLATCTDIYKPETIKSGKFRRLPSKTQIK